MKVSGQLRNAQVELVTAKPTAPGCTGQFVYETSGGSKNLWVYGDNRWQLINNLPHFSYGSNDMFTDTTQGFVIDEDTYARYDTTRVVNGGTVTFSTPPFGGTRPFGYIAPYDGSLDLTGIATDLRTNNTGGIQSVAGFELEFHVNGQPVATGRDNSFYVNQRWITGSNQERITITNDATIQVKAGDEVRLFLVKNFSGTSQHLATAFDGRYTEAFCPEVN